MQPKERNNHLEKLVTQKEQAHLEKERLQEAIHMAARERSHHQVETNTHNSENRYALGYYSIET